MTKKEELPFMLKCKKCGYRWIRKGEKLPLRCPHPLCQSPHWNGKKGG